MTRRLLRGAALAFRRFGPSWAASVGAATLAGLAVLGGLTGAADRLLADSWFGQAGETPSGTVVLLDIGPAIPARGDGLSLPRSELARLVERSAGLGAERVLIDLTLSTASSEAEDGALEDTLSRLGRGRVAIVRSAVPDRDPSGRTRWSRLPSLPRFGDAAPVASDLAFDPDGLLRRDGIAAASPRLPGAAAWLADVSPPDARRPLAIDFGIDARLLPVEDGLAVLEGRLAPGHFAGKRVLIANLSSPLAGAVPVPRFGALRRPLVTALAAETLRLGRVIREPGSVATALGIAILAALATLWLGRLGPLLAGAAAFGLWMCGFGLGPILLRQVGFVLPAGSLGLALGLAFGAALLGRHPALQRVRDALASLMNQTDLRLARVLNETGEALVTFSPTGQVLSMNGAARRIFAASEPGEASVRDLLGVHSEALFAAARVSRPSRLEATIERREGGARHLDLTVNAMPADRGEWIGIASIRDVTDQRLQLDALRRLAIEDPLTGLLNRAGFDAALERASATANAGGDRAALLIGDLDGFKTVNDTLGHSAGDELLRVVAARLKATVPAGTVLGRLGGDEFAVLLRGEAAARDAAPLLAKACSRAVAEPIRIDGTAARVGISLGLAHAEPGSTPASLIRAADVAMYELKRAGRRAAATPRVA